MELATETAQLQLDQHRTQAVRVKHICLDRWEAYYEGKWRKVIIQVDRTYIKVRDTKLTINIDGL